MGAKLIAHLRNRRPHLLDVEPGPAEQATILDEFLRDLVTEDAEDEIDRGLENGRSVHRASAHGTPASPEGNRVGEGNRRSISRMMTWVSQNTSAPICITGVRR